MAAMDMNIIVSLETLKFWEEKVHSTEKKSYYYGRILSELEKCLQSDVLDETTLNKLREKKTKYLKFCTSANEKVGSSLVTQEKSFEEKYQGVILEEIPQISWENDVILPQRMKRKIFRQAVFPLIHHEQETPGKGICTIIYVYCTYLCMYDVEIGL